MMRWIARLPAGERLRDTIEMTMVSGIMTQFATRLYTAAANFRGAVELAAIHIFCMRALCAGILAAAIILPATAASRHDMAGRRMEGQMQQAPGGYQAQPPREMRGPGPAPAPVPAQRPNGRLTDEERRDLHRDLDRANREIYKGRQ
jgi:hypothetical protein